ncbi:unspecified product [Leptomonas pyrrhocoris]|uniref:Unspecified product n=1 Tax=Leptomonas pyrrhocoris TaxID=157538 RepID=A0A0M9G3S2_LEPPY|nr:unspecified product [Leptomonas pyrrhocoris]KPA81820.1 unspecified product [Leptomonas pyrrhocoris]|eukprot:XP_015660259.1 unspecified product [Leptomonas pyrrhocoris]
MLFRSRRNSGGGGAISPRQSSTLVGNFAPGGPTAYERPSSAPVAGVVPLQPNSSTALAFASPKADEVQNVEDRLSIVKRSRTASAAKPFANRDSGSAAAMLHSPDFIQRSVDPSPSGLGGAVAANTGVVPPCSSYPTFNLTKLPKHEQHVMDALLSEFTEVLFFRRSEGD